MIGLERYVSLTITAPQGRAGLLPSLLLLLTSP